MTTKMNSELYKTTIESFGVTKPSKVLTSEARKIAMGKPGNMKVIKAEIARCKLLERPTVTPKQQERINKLTTQVDQLLKPKEVKLPKGRVQPQDPRKVKPKAKPSSDEEVEC
jgi:hypothetical protein